MGERGAIARAGFWKRAAARVIDTFLSALLAALVVVGAVFIAAVVAQPDLFSDENWEAYYMLLMLLMLPAAILVIRYEVAATARRGQTVGKRTMGINVVLWDDEAAAPGSGAECAGPLYCLIRWAVPHGACVFAGLVAGVVAVLRIGGFGVLVGFGVGLAAWTIVYFSAVLDRNGRGWHDKIAGTVVVEGAPGGCRRLRG